MSRYVGNSTVCRGRLRNRNGGVEGAGKTVFSLKLHKNKKNKKNKKKKYHCIDILTCTYVPS